jgi:hypothetical protein
MSPWATVRLAGGVSGVLPLSWPVTAVLLTELAGQSRATVTRLCTVSNQLGAVGGVLLALGSFPLVGMFCLVTAALAAEVIRGKVRRAVARSMPLSPS